MVSTERGSTIGSVDQWFFNHSAGGRKCEHRTVETLARSGRVALVHSIWIDFPVCIRARQSVTEKGKNKSNKLTTHVEARHYDTETCAVGRPVSRPATQLAS